MDVEASLLPRGGGAVDPDHRHLLHLSAYIHTHTHTQNSSATRHARGTETEQRGASRRSREAGGEERGEGKCTVEVAVGEVESGRGGAAPCGSRGIRFARRAPGSRSPATRAPLRRGGSHGRRRTRSGMPGGSCELRLCAVRRRGLRGPRAPCSGSFCLV